MIRRPPRSTRTDTTLSLHDALPISMDDAAEQASFGYEQVSREEKTRRVGDVFRSVAARSDLMNDLMSGGLHRLWKDQLVRRVKPRPGEAILDMAGGTGDTACRLGAPGGGSGGWAGRGVEERE